MQILGDWASAVTFDSAAIQNERNVVLEEWRLHLGANDRMQKQYIPVLLKGSKYASHIPIGTKESILNTPNENIRRFYKTWYRPDLMAVIIVGDVNPDSMLQKVKKQFSRIQEPNPIPIKEIYTVPENREPLISQVKDAENTGTHITLAYKCPVKKFVNDSDYLNRIKISMICTMLNQRLTEKTMELNPPYIAAGLPMEIYG